jgi:Helix-turn-helix domain
MAFTPKLISRQDAAATLGVSVRTVDRLRAEGQLETWPVRGRAMITVASLERFLACETKPEPAAPNWDGCEIPALERMRAERQRAREEREAA